MNKFWLTLAVGLLGFGAIPAYSATNLAVVCTGMATSNGCSPHKYDYPRETDVVLGAQGWTLYSSLDPADTLQVCKDDVSAGSPSNVTDGSPCTDWELVAKSTVTAATPTAGKAVSLTATWTLPTAADDGTPLVGSQALTGIELYVSTSPIPDTFNGAPVATFAGDMVQATYNGTVPNGATLYVRVKAVNSGGASRFSAEATKLIEIPVSVPGVPTGVEIHLLVR